MGWLTLSIFARMNLLMPARYPRVAGVFLLIFSFSACDVPQDLDSQDRDGSPGYYDLKLLIEGQVAYLDSLNPQVRKSTREAQEDKFYQENLQISNWQSELNMFSQANINRPILKGVYQVRDSSAGGDMYTVYTCQEADKPIRKLQVKKAPGQDKAEEVHVWLEQANLLYGSKRELILHLEPYPPGQRIKRYRMLGHQASVFGTSLTYNVEGEILY